MKKFELNWTVIADHCVTDTIALAAICQTKLDS